MPSNSDNIDNQEALAGEGVERDLYEALEVAEVTLRLDGQRMAQHGMSVLQNEEAHKTVTAALRKAALRTLPSNEALAGDDRNGVEGLIERLRQHARTYAAADKMMADAKSDRQTDRADHPELGQRGYASIAPEQTDFWKAADMLELLSRTPSSPQADEEWVRGTADFSCLGRCDGMGVPDPAGSYLRMAVAPKTDETRRYKLSLGGAQVLADELLSTMTTRPAGVEEVDPDVRRRLLSVCDTLESAGGQAFPGGPARGPFC